MLNQDKSCWCELENNMNRTLIALPQLPELELGHVFLQQQKQYNFQYGQQLWKHKETNYCTLIKAIAFPASTPFFGTAARLYRVVTEIFGAFFPNVQCQTRTLISDSSGERRHASFVFVTL